jgi:hypothetical protein
MTPAIDLTSEPAIDLTSRVEWWATSAGTVPVERTRAPDGNYVIQTWPRIWLWI